jgi:hypothetical protein
LLEGVLHASSFCWKQTGIVNFKFKGCAAPFVLFSHSIYSFLIQLILLYSKIYRKRHQGEIFRRKSAKRMNIMPMCTVVGLAKYWWEVKFLWTSTGSITMAR